MSRECKPSNKRGSILSAQMMILLKGQGIEGRLPISETADPSVKHMFYGSNADLNWLHEMLKNTGVTVTNLSLSLNAMLEENTRLTKVIATLTGEAGQEGSE